MGRDYGEQSSGDPLLPTVSFSVVVFSTLVAVSGSYVFGSAAMGFSEMFCLLGWAGILFLKGPWWLDYGRLSVGYNVGILSYVVPIYIAEITPKNLRGAFTTVNQFMICCGVSVMYLVGNFSSWRILTILGIVPCVLHLQGLVFMPESPRWLAKIGREKDSESALQCLRGKNADISAESAEIRDYIETLQQLSDTSFFDLFQRKYAHSLIVGVGLLVLQQLGGVNGITYYASAIFVSAGLSSRFGTVDMVFVQFMICCGVSVMYLVGNFSSWRILTILGIVPCVLHLQGLVFMPESPRWLAKIGREKDSESALQCLRGKNADISAESAEIRDYIETLQQLSDTSFFDLFQRKYAHSLIVGVGLLVLQQLGGVNGITYYASAIFVSAGLSSRFGTVDMVFVQVPMTLLGVLLMDKSGRRPLLMISATCLGCFFVGLSFLLQDLQLWKEISRILALFGVLIFTGSFSLGMGGIPWIIMSEIFPINIKGPAGSLVTVVNWFGTWVISYAFNFLMKWSSEGTFYIFSVACGLTIVFVAKLVPESTGHWKKYKHP